MKNAIRNKLLRMVFIASVILIALLILLEVVQFIRLDIERFEESAQMLVDLSRKISEKASANYQAEALASLPSNKKNGTFFRLDNLLGEALVLEKPSLRPTGGVPKVVLSFEFDNPSQLGLVPNLGKSILNVDGGILRVQHDNSDYLENEALIEIPKDEVADIVIRARANRGTQMTLGWHREIDPSKRFRHKNRIDIDLIADNRFRTYVINAKNALKRGLKTGEKIRKIILEPSNIDGAIVEIDFIRFISKRSKYFEQPHGTGYETIGKEMRHILYMLPDQTLEYSLHVPLRSPTFDFGAGVLMNDEPITFEVSILDNAQRTNIYKREVISAASWQDARLDLSPWAGKKVKLSLRVSGSSDNVAFWSNPFVSSNPNERFNVIIVLEDALRADHLSIYGYKLPTSPFKESLMKQTGIVFLRAISQATKTRPSVPTLMTSLIPTATGVWHFSDMLNDEYLTMAEILRSRGFVTASFIQNGNAGPYAGLHQGFSYIFDEESVGVATERIFGDRLVDWLERQKDRNFFLYLHVADPHGVYDPPAPFDRWYREAAPSPRMREKFDPRLDPSWIEHPTLEGRRLLYDGEIQHNDTVLMKFLKRLSVLGIYNNTLLVFTSDHGEHLGEHGLWDHHPPGYIQVINVPLMIVYPDRFSKRKSIPQRVQLIDIMPTILELAGVESSKLVLQGNSLVDLIQGRNLSFWENRICVSEEPVAMSKNAPYACGSLFFRDWHIISSKRFSPRGVPAVARMKVFNLRDNRDETWDIKSHLPNIYLRYKFWKTVSELQSNNIAAWKKWTAGGQENTYKQDPDVLERLRGLGYVR